MPVLLWGAPGWLVSRWLLPAADVFERTITALAFGIATVAPLTYLATVVTGWRLSPEMATTVSVLVASVALMLLRFGKGPEPLAAAEARLPRGQAALLLLVTVMTAVTAALLTRPAAVDALHFGWHCPHLASLYLIDGVADPGLVAWDPFEGSHVTHVLRRSVAGAEDLRSVLQLQRPGSTAYLAPLLLFLSSGGITVAIACADLLVLGFAVLLVGRHLRSPLGRMLVATVFFVGARALASYRFNENMIALALSMAALHLLVRSRTALVTAPVATLVAALLAHVVGVRSPALSLAVAALVLMRATPGTRVRFAFAFLAALSPWLLVNLKEFGTLVHVPELEVARQTQRLFDDTLFEVEFQFHPLNFPVADQLYRPPLHPFPTLIRLPLEQLQAFGAPLLALALAGLIPMARERRSLLVGLLLWGVPVQLLLMAIVQLGYHKMSYVLLSLAPLPLLAGAALGNLQLRLWPRVLLATTLAFALVVAPLLVRDVELPVDRRGHADFEPDLRDSEPDDLKRDRLTRGSLGPYLGAELDPEKGDAFGWELLANARAVVERDRIGKPLAPAPLVLWAPFPPESFAHAFLASTTEAPWAPSMLIGRGATVGLGTQSGTFVVAVRFDAPAPAVASVRLHRDGARYDIAVSRSGTSTIPGPRYVSFAVGDRGTVGLESPRLSVDGIPVPAQGVEYWCSEPQCVGQPRLVSNEPWSVAVGEEGILLRPGPARVLPALEGVATETLCTDRGATLLSRCLGRECTWYLADAAAAPHAARAAQSSTAVGSGPIFTWGDDGRRLLGHGGRCADRFFGRNPVYRDVSARDRKR